MSLALTSSLLGLLGSIVVAAFTYWFTKRREREAEWRKEKLVYYKAFIESMSGIVEGDATPDGHRYFAKTTNNLLLFAPQAVIEALNAFRSEISVANSNRSRAMHDKLFGELLLAIRRDIGVRPTDNFATFKPILWTSGVGKGGI